MFIHTVSQGESLHDISKLYSVAASLIIDHNGLTMPDRLCEGQKLMIFTPTRTHSVKGGDTLDKISHRFGVSPESLLRNNPSLISERKSRPGEILSIKYDTPRFGLGLANGYLYSGCTRERLLEVLPYLSYLTVSALKLEGGKIIHLFDPGSALKLAREANKAAILRIYSSDAKISDGGDELCKRIAELAVRSGYSGVSLAAYRAAHEDKDFGEFLLALRKKLLREDLLLFTELDGNSDEIGFSEADAVSDGVSLNYEKCSMQNIPSFECGERRLLSEYAEKYECAKAFVEIPCFAYDGSRPISVSDAVGFARKHNKKISYDPERKICHYEYTRFSHGEREAARVAFESAENVKAKLELIGELGFMGIAFDIMRIPREYLMLFHTSFRCPEAQGVESSRLDCRGNPQK